MLAVVMVVAASLGAGAAYWASQAEEESIILKQRLVVGRLQEVAIWAHYVLQYGTWTILINEANDHRDVGLRLSRTADSVRDVDQVEAERLDLQARIEFAQARTFRTFYHFLKRPDDILSIDATLTRDVSAELAKFGLGVDEETPQAASQKPQAGQQATTNSASAMLDLKLWHSLEHSIKETHERVLKFSLVVILYVVSLVLFTFADLSNRHFGRACLFALAGLGIVIANAVFSIAADVSFLIVVGIACIAGIIIVAFAYMRGLLRPGGAKGETLHPHEVENKSYWGASLFLREAHDGRSRVAIALIASSVLLSSGVGYLYVHASTMREELSQTALKNQVAFGRSSTTSAAVATAGGVQPSTIQLAKQIHCMAVRQQELFPRKDAEKKLSEFGGIGVELERDGGTRVVSVRESGAAAHAGIREGDIITHIDGEDIEAMPLSSVVNRLRGPIGMPVAVRISRRDAKSPVELTVTRAKVAVEITVAENTATLVRNSRIACEDLNSETSIKQQDVVRNANYDSGYDPGSEMYYKLIYFLPRGNPATFYALADGYEELAALWSKKATVYLANLTLFAIGLYLFGQALGVGSTWQADTFLGFGSFLVALSAGWSLVTWVGLPESSPDVPAQCSKDIQVEAHEPAERFVEIAAYQYGKAEGLFNLAETPADFRKVADALDCSVAARPNFGRAQSLRSSAYKFMDPAYRRDTYLPASSWSKTQEIIEARQQALRAFQSNNVTPSWITRDNAFDQLVMALMDGKPDTLAAAIAAHASEVAIDERRTSKGGTPNASLYLNYGLALLAGNRPDDAEAIYRRAINELDRAKDRTLTVQALADLRMLETNCPNLQPAQTCADLAAMVRKTKQNVVAAKWLDGPINRPGLSDVSIEITPSSASWRGKLDPLTVHEGQKVTVVWYLLDRASADRRPEGKMMWRTVDGLTQTIDVANLKPSPDGTIGSAVPYLKEQSSCLVEGDYVPEIYIDGVLASPPDLSPVSLKRFETYRSRYLNLVTCHPPDWHALPGTWQEPMRLIVDSKGHATVSLFTFYAPRTRSTEQQGIDHVETALRYISDTNTKPLPAQEMADWIAGAHAFRGCNGTLAKGMVPYREWTTSEGFVHIALAFPWTPVEDACLFLSSVENYFAPYSLPAKK